MFAILGGHGAFFTAQVNEKVARGWVKTKGATAEDAEEAATARSSGGPAALSSRGQDDCSAGLVE